MSSSRRGAVATWWTTVAWGRHKWLVVALAVVAVFVVLSGGYVLLVQSRLSRVDVTLHPSRRGGTTYLIVGTDSRAGVPREQRAGLGSVPGARADMVLLLRVFDDGARPLLVSVPRDLLVLEQDRGLHRLALTWRSGPQATIDALCQSLGVGADHLVRIDLAGFDKIVEAVGGVDIHLDAPIRDSVLSLTLPAGTVHLDGALALSYVRARHLEQFDGEQWVPLPNQRAEQARNVLSAVARKAKPSVTDPVGAHRLLWTVSGALGTDGGTGLRDLWRLGSALRSVDPAVDDELPATIDDAGPIPFAQLDPGAASMLRRAGAGGKACPRAALPEASLAIPVG